jgi:hypothetical protein
MHPWLDIWLCILFWDLSHKPHIRGLSALTMLEVSMRRQRFDSADEIGDMLVGDVASAYNARSIWVLSAFISD